MFETSMSGEHYLWLELERRRRDLTAHFAAELLTRQARRATGDAGPRGARRGGGCRTAPKEDRGWTAW